MPTPSAEDSLSPRVDQGEEVEVELVPGGSELEVTRFNRRRYVRRLLEHLLQEQGAQAAATFRRGVLDVIAEPALLSRTLFVRPPLPLLCVVDRVDRSQSNCNRNTFKGGGNATLAVPLGDARQASLIHRPLCCASNRNCRTHRSCRS
eukprot:SAG11_NODE_752_length_7351_cov_4.119691_4_plen_148_part_00